MIQALAEPLQETAAVKTLGKLTAEQRQTIERLLGDGELSNVDISQQVGCTHQVVSLVKYDVVKPEVKQSLADPAVVSELEDESIRVLKQIFKRITPGTKEEKLRALGATFSEFFKAARLLSGESTQNIATKNLSTLIVKIHNKAKTKAVKTKQGRGGDTPGGDSGGDVSGE